MTAYLAMMAPRLVELRRVLKETGSIYLHCDPTASHYLKMLMDAVFGPAYCRSEGGCQRSHAHNAAQRYGRNHDTILFYGRASTPTWNPVYQKYDLSYVDKHYRHLDPKGRRYKHENPTGAGTRRGETGLPWRGVDPTAKGRHWAVPPKEMDRLDAHGMIYWTKKRGGWPYIKVYLDERKGIPAQDTWTDIDPINMVAAERLGYPTQKPEALLERIITASSNESDLVLDPFCGCGTTIAVAQRLKRRWVGIDITHLAVTLIKHRLQSAFGKRATYSVVGEPTSLPDAKALAEQDKFQFQVWALGLVGARPAELKKGADQGIDGRLYFHDGKVGGKTKQIILSVKGGHTSVKDLRDLRGVLDREKADMGALITMEEPTKPMRTEAAGAGFYMSPAARRYPRLQVLTIEELLDGKGIDYPPEALRTDMTFKKAPAALPKVAEPRLPLGGGEEE